MIWWLIVIMMLLLVGGISFLIYLFGPWMRWTLETIRDTIKEAWDSKMDWADEMREELERRARKKYSDKF